MVDIYVASPSPRPSSRRERGKKRFPCLTLRSNKATGSARCVLVLAVSILLVSIFYFHTFRTLRRGQWQTLLLLRIIAIVIIVLLLFRPVFSYHRDLGDQAGGDLPAGQLGLDEHRRRRHQGDPFQPGPQAHRAVVRRLPEGLRHPDRGFCREASPAGRRQGPGRGGPRRQGHGHRPGDRVGVEPIGRPRPGGDGPLFRRHRQLDPEARRDRRHQGQGDPRGGGRQRASRATSTIATSWSRASTARTA